MGKGWLGVRPRPCNGSPGQLKRVTLLQLPDIASKARELASTSGTRGARHASHHSYPLLLGRSMGQIIRSLLGERPVQTSHLFFSGAHDQRNQLPGISSCDSLIGLKGAGKGEKRADGAVCLISVRKTTCFQPDVYLRERKLGLDRRPLYSAN